jgi:amino acid transporter
MLKSKFFWISLILLMFVPMVINFAFKDEIVTVFHNDFRPDNYILSDFLFYEAGFFLVFGAMLAGAVLFIGWKPDRLALFVEPVFRWTIIKKEREIPAALLLGLLIIGIGIIYISASVIVTL